MRVAQEATSFTSSGQGNAPGIFLVEHRRCRANIIGFCNDLIYNGLLQPMRQEPTAVPPLPALAWAHVQGASLQAGGSQYNEKEAGAVAQWIVDNAAAWVAHYRPSKIGHKLALAEIVAVLTPFGAQKQLIQHKLAALTSIYDLTAITIGTVHAMQGAERDIVVFSPTSDDSVKGLFLDRKPNLLNVAVSRAKDSFVLIGDMRVMRRPGSKPSALLGKALLARGKELLDVGGNYRFSTSMALKGERISTLKRHVELLNEAVMDAAAGDEVVIVSPWVTLRAVEFPPFLGNCKSAVERGVSIHVVYDAELTEAYLRKDAKNGQVFELLSEANIQVTAVNKIHSKTILTREAITEGSFNWLSAQRYPDDAYIRHETSWRISGPAAETAILEAYEELRQLGVTFTGSLPAAASTKPAVPPTQKVMDVQPGRRLNSPFSMAAAHARVRQLDQERKP